VLTACHKYGIGIVSAHVDLSLRLEAEDRAQREAATEAVVESIRFLGAAGGKVLVGHFGASDRARAVVEEVLSATEDSNVCVTTENMRGGLEPYAALVDKVKSPRFGLTVDVGHARDTDGVNPFTKPGRARQALSAAKGRVLHLHLHETLNLDQKPDHRPPLHPEGIIQWADVFAGLRDIEYEGCLLFEDGRGEDPEEWTRMTAAFPDAFVARYQ
jgi:sugar phosphate isomerase/epimerase